MTTLFRPRLGIRVEGVLIGNSITYSYPTADTPPRRRAARSRGAVLATAVSTELGENVPLDRLTEFKDAYIERTVIAWTVRSKPMPQ